MKYSWIKAVGNHVHAVRSTPPAINDSRTNCEGTHSSSTDRSISPTQARGMARYSHGKMQSEFPCLGSSKIRWPLMPDRKVQACGAATQSFNDLSAVRNRSRSGCGSFGWLESGVEVVGIEQALAQSAVDSNVSGKSQERTFEYDAGLFGPHTKSRARLG